MDERMQISMSFIVIVVTKALFMSVLYSSQFSGKRFIYPIKHTLMREYLIWKRLMMALIAHNETFRCVKYPYVAHSFVHNVCLVAPSSIFRHTCQLWVSGSKKQNEKHIVFSLHGMFACIAHIKNNKPHMKHCCGAETYFNMTTTVFLLVKF